MSARPKLPLMPPFCAGPFVRHHPMSSWIMGQSPFGGLEHMADIRGWGFLTGRGQALALTEIEAVKAQSETLDWIVEAMNEKWEREAKL